MSFQDPLKQTESVEDDHYYDGNATPMLSRSPPPPPERTMETTPVTTATPTANSEWFKFMREEREASDRRVREMLEALNLGRAPSEGNP